jgi:nucleotide-binding universal stress UspA family protein
METIVVGTDFSGPAKNAVYYASELAKYFSAKLILVNAVPMPLNGYGSMAPLQVMAELQSNSEQLLKELKQEIIRKNYDFGIECVSEIGNCFGVINDVAKRYSADLLVMGMVGEGGLLKRHLIGSSALHAAREITIPLFIVPEAVTYRRIHQICFACDMDHIEETTLLHTVKYFATAFDAEIELVTIKKSSEEIAWNTNETYAFVEKRLLNTKHKNVYIKDHNTSQALEYYFKFHRTDLVMVNPKKHGFFKTLFAESVTKNLAFNIELPLLVVH